MIIYCMSDIHGCLNEFKDALSLIRKQLDKPDTMLVFLGDYIHYGPDGRGVIDRIMQLQQEIGKDRLVAILGNHEEAVIDGFSGIDNDNNASNKASKENDKKYIEWLRKPEKTGNGAREIISSQENIPQISVRFRIWR